MTPLARRQGRLTCCMRGGFDRCAVWSDAPVEAVLVALLMEEWAARGAIAHGDCCDYDLVLEVERCRLELG